MADRPLSARVRAGTRAEHDAAQGSGFLDAPATGRLPLDAYADLAVQHWFVYETLEDAGRTMAEDPVAGRFVLPELDRAPALAADLAYGVRRAPLHPLPR
jgi:heme oxygenase